MPALDKVARFSPVRPGAGKFALLNFNGSKLLGDYKNGIELLVVRRNDNRLADWVSEESDGFIKVTPHNCRQFALDFEFEVGPKVINPMAFDNTGDYVIKVRDTQGIIHSFAVAMQGTPRPDSGSVHNGSASVLNNAASKNFGAGGTNNSAEAKSEVPPFDPSQSRANLHQAAVASQTAAMQKKAHATSVIIKILGILCVLALLAGAFFFVKDMMNSSSGANNSEAVTQQSAPQDDKAKDEGTPKSTEQSAQASAPVTNSEPVIYDAPTVKQVMNMRVIGNSTLAECQLSSSNNQGNNEKQVLSNCLKVQPKNEELHGLLLEALRQNKCEIANRIISTQARSGEFASTYAYAIAQLTDPNSKLSNACFNKDSNNAAYWYKKVEADKNFKQEQGAKLVNELFPK